LRKQLLEDISIEEIVGSTLLVIIIIAVFLGTMTRYVLGRPLFGTEEISTVLFVWVVILGAVSAFRRDLHIGIDFIVNLLPQKIKVSVEIFGKLLLALVFLSLIYFGIFFATTGTMKYTSIFRISYFYIYISIPLMGAILFIVNLKNIYSTIKNLKQ